MRNQIYTYVKKKYKTAPEFLWQRFPNYAVFRHEDNRKWFGLIMDVPRSKLGLDGDDWVDVNELDRLIEFLKETKAELVVNRCREVYPSYSQVVGCDIDYEIGKVYDF